MREEHVDEALGRRLRLVIGEAGAFVGLNEGVVGPQRRPDHQVDAREGGAREGGTIKKAVGEVGVGKVGSGEVGPFGYSELVGVTLGTLYEAATQFCGFKSNYDEGKTMGLAPYGDPTPCYKKVADLVRVGADGSIWLFSNPDAWGAIGAAHLTEANGALRVDWTDSTFLNTNEHGLHGLRTTKLQDYRKAN